MTDENSMTSVDVEDAGWLDAGGRRIFTVAHIPASGRVRGAVVLCQPLLTEQYAAHETFIRLARALTAKGLAALRFDYSSMGDSEGAPQDLRDVGVWVNDISAAVDHLRLAGASFVAVLGMRAAANIVAEAVGHNDADAAVLWDPFPNGRAFVRHATLLHQSIAAVDTRQSGTTGLIDSCPLTPLQPKGDYPLGYSFSDHFLDSLRALHLDALPTGLPTLVLTRSGELPAALTNPAFALAEAGTAVGQDALLETFLDAAVVPEHSIGQIASWLGARTVDQFERQLDIVLEPTLQQPGSPYGVRESPLRIPVAGGTTLFSIRASATGTDRTDRAGAPLTCVLLNSGVQPHTGPNRLYVDLARELATKGVNSIRVDLPGLGESRAAPGETTPLVYAPRFLDDVDAAIQVVGNGPVAAIGLCSGGYHALEAATRTRLAGVLSIHLIPDLGLLGRPHLFRSDRAIWVPDRRWLERVNRSRWGVAVTWRLPGWAWSVLDRIGLQTEQGAGIRRVVATGTDVVMIMEAAELGRPRSWPLLRRRTMAPRIILSSADHSLFDVENRNAMRELVCRIVLDWSASSPALTHGTSATDSTGTSLAAG
jgi:alpha-beta hydrolase superfamily lysophospholipase